MSNSVLNTDIVVFDSIEHLNEFCNVEVKLPNSIPDDCNLVCYRINGDKLDSFKLYKETDRGLFSFFSFQGIWEYSSKSLESEIVYDKRLLPRKYIYVRVNLKPKAKVNDLFTPRCLLGVETDYGHITEVVRVTYFSEVSYFAYTTESLSKEDLKDIRNLRYYISDDSDETISLDEYIEMFYHWWGGK